MSILTTAGGRRAGMGRASQSSGPERNTGPGITRMPTAARIDGGLNAPAGRAGARPAGYCFDGAGILERFRTGFYPSRGPAAPAFFAARSKRAAEERGEPADRADGYAPVNGQRPAVEVAGQYPWQTETAATQLAEAP